MEKIKAMLYFIFDNEPTALSITWVMLSLLGATSGTLAIIYWCVNNLDAWSVALTVTFLWASLSYKFYKEANDDE